MVVRSRNLSLNVHDWQKPCNEPSAPDDPTRCYRIYLIERATIDAAETFVAKNHADATEIAASVHSACSDVFTAYELWQGTTRIASSPTHVDLELADQRHHAAIAEIELRLIADFAFVKRSRKLIGCLERCHAKPDRERSSE